MWICYSVTVVERLFVKRFALCYRTVVCLTVVSVTLVYYGQTVGWIKMPLGRKPGLGSGDNVLDGDPALPPRKGHSSPHFSAYVYCGQTAGWIKMPVGTKVGLGPGHIVLDGDPAPPKSGTSPNFQPMSVTAKRLDESRFKMPLGTEVGLGPGDIVLDGDPAPTQKGAQLPQISAHVYCGQTVAHLSYC